ncbi:MFS transporter [Paenibacillus crassostreae]|uniref:MFS transporter n=1 Tax=Paenibacillus crassostreae TaxID=1763538 RepID=A0A167DKV5_9BACL|nr:MFS transporter [Paenibacillus crassostreae]AOZ91335.1 MFS transporter [Paenibacillus crassostreae]OAB74506.1 MFS transporter [Paenibacillus crassostreae]
MSEQRAKGFKKNYGLQLATIFIGFIIFGISENIKGPAIPRIQMDFNLDEIQLGTLLSLNALGYLIACSFTALLTRKIGIKWSSLIAFGSMLISGILIFVSHNYTFFSASYFLMYIGNGMLEIALAILGARIFVRNTGTMMNLSHFFYGLSSTVAPLLASGLMTLTVFEYTLDWRGMYLVMLCLSVIPMIPAVMSRFPGDDLLDEDRIPFKVLVRDPALWLLVAILSFGVVSELAVGGWLVNFLEKSYGWNTTVAAGMLSTFFLFFSGARLFLGPVTDKIGFNLSIILLSGFAGICTFIAILAGEPAAIFFALAGIGIAPIYPTVMAFIAKRYPTGSDTAITFTVTMMGIGSVIGNYIIGAIINVVKNIYGTTTEIGLLRGLQAGYGFIGLCALICSFAGMILYKYLKKRNELI